MKNKFNKFLFYFFSIFIGNMVIYIIFHLIIGIIDYIIMNRFDFMISIEFIYGAIASGFFVSLLLLFEKR